MTCINKSMDLLQLKDKSAGDDNVFESHVVEDSDDDDVRETCVVEDSDSDGDSGEVFIWDINNNLQKTSPYVFKDVSEIDLSSKRRHRLSLRSAARKKLRRSS